MSDPTTIHTTTLDGRVPGDRTARPALRTWPTTVPYQGLRIELITIPAGTVAAGYTRELVPSGLRLLQWLAFNGSPTGTAPGFGGATGAMVIDGKAYAPGGQTGGASPALVSGYHLTTMTLTIDTNQVDDGVITFCYLGTPVPVT